MSPCSTAVSLTSARGLSPSLKQRLGALLIPRMPITRFLFDQLRSKINGATVRLENAVLPTRQRTLKRIRKMREIRAT